MFFPRQPIQHAQQVHGSSRQQMLKMDFGHADVAGAAHSQRMGRLGNRAFNARPLVVGFLEGFGVLALAGSLQGTELRFRDENQLPPLRTGVQRWRIGHAKQTLGANLT